MKRQWRARIAKAADDIMQNNTDGSFNRTGQTRGMSAKPHRPSLPSNQASGGAVLITTTSFAARLAPWRKFAQQGALCLSENPPSLSQYPACRISSGARTACDGSDKTCIARH